MKALGLRPRAFICFSVFGTPDETLALVFDILLQRRPPGSQTYMRRGTSSQFRPGVGVNFLEDGQITNQASQPEGEAHISGTEQEQGKVPGCSTRSELCSTPKFPVAIANQSNTGMLPVKENLRWLKQFSALKF